MEITSWRATDDFGCSSSRMVCPAHLAAALEDVSSALLTGQIHGLSVMTAPIPHTELGPADLVPVAMDRPRAGAR